MRFNLRSRLLTGFALICSIITVGGGLSVINTSRLSAISTNIVSQEFPLYDAIMEVKYIISNSHRILEEVLAGDKGEDITKVWDGLDIADDYFSCILNGGTINGTTFTPNNDTAIQKQVRKAQTKLEQFRNNAETRFAIYSAAISNDDAPETRRYVGAGSNIEKETDLLFSQLEDAANNSERTIKKHIQGKLTRANLSYRNSKNIILVDTILCLILSIVIGLILARHITPPITLLTAGLKKLAQGNIEQEIHTSNNDEIGDMSRSYMAVLSSMREAAELAGQVSQGNYEITIEPKSDQDLLANALKEMTAKLKNFDQIKSEQFWLTESRTTLIEEMRGELDIDIMAGKITSFLAAKLNAQIISCYIITDDNTLRLAGSYGIDSTVGRTNIKIGQGLVGQTVKEKHMLKITDIPANYIRVSSSLGDCPPRQIVIQPFMHDSVVKGVLEIACCQIMPETCLQLLDNISSSIAIAVHGAQVHERISQLLDESQCQNEELQAQQEELQAANEELEEKTGELINSEAKLLTQQEKLRVTNEDLEARSSQLSKQKDDISQKAQELEIAGKYKSEFLANMSHELRTPLNSILILSQLLAKNKDTNLTEKQLDFANTINSSGNDLLNLINEVLDLAKVESGHMQINAEEIDLVDFMEDMERGFAPLATEKSISLKFKIRDKAPRKIQTDAQRFQQIIKNLLSNAIKFTDAGSVTLTIDMSAPNEVFTRSMLTPAHSIAITVSDTGIGVAPDKQKLIFEAFQQEDGTTSRKYGGTGLGLSIAREMAFFLGGEIRLASAAGKGAAFTLFLPTTIKTKLSSPSNPNRATAKTVAPPANESTRPTIAPLTLPGIKDDRRNINSADRVLLIIEDDPNFTKILLDLSRQRGFKCIVADDGESGLQCANFYRPSAIILDIGLPRMDGWAVMDHLKENPHTRHIPVHFISATDLPHDGMLKGAIGFLTKPVLEEDMQAAMAKIEQVISRDVKNLLIVEDDETQRQSIIELIGSSDVASTAVGSGVEALELIKSMSFDCMILDLGLNDMSGFELLEKIRLDRSIPKLPIIIYTGRDLTSDEQDKLDGFAESIIIKGARSPERLLAEATLFLHRVEADLPEDQQQILSNVQKRESLLDNRKILIVDDDMRNVFALSSVLQEKGMQILVAKTGIEALEILDSSPKVDIVLMDIMMPEMDGFEAMEKIRVQNRFKKLPIIALTAKTMKGDKNKCIEAGANDYLAKPVDIDRLISLLRVWLYK